MTLLMIAGKKKQLAQQARHRKRGSKKSEVFSSVR